MLALAAGILTSPEARGATIDTLDFSESNWSFYPTLSPVSGTLTGSFTGTVEADDLIEQGDLTSFSVSFTVGSLFEIIPLAELTLFSYNLNGGPSSLDIAGMPQPVNICVGAATALDPNCTVDFEVAYPAGTVGVVELGDVPDFVSSSFPTITLVSSVTTLTTPEPPYALLMAIVLIVIGLLRRRETRASE
jgi:hypothetical protein